MDEFRANRHFTSDHDAIAVMMTRQQKRLSELTESIFTKWKWQLNMNGGFIRWINGNRIDYTPSNIVFVSPQDAMRNIDSWTVDWDMELDADEIAYSWLMCTKALYNARSTYTMQFILTIPRQ